MTKLHEQIETALPIEESFAFIADFANSSRWDPGVATSERIDAGPVGLGARYRLGVRMRGKVAPMEYRITTYEAPTRVVLTGVPRFFASTPRSLLALLQGRKAVSRRVV